MSSDRPCFSDFGRRCNAGGTPTIFALFLHHDRRDHIYSRHFERVIAMLSRFFFVANYTLSYWSLFVLPKERTVTALYARIALGDIRTRQRSRLIGSILFLIGIDRHGPPQRAACTLLLLVASYPIFSAGEIRRTSKAVTKRKRPNRQKPKTRNAFFVTLFHLLLRLRFLQILLSDALALQEQHA